MGNFFNFNGQVLSAGHEVQERAARSCREDDGLFETMRVHHDDIVLKEYHFERLSAGMRVLKIELPENLRPENLHDRIRELCFVNGHQSAARVRLTVFKSDINTPGVLIESWPLDPLYTLPQGLTIGVYAGAHKTSGPLSSYKTNYQLYADAAAFAREQQWDDCLVLNSQGNVCDTSISNIFWIKDGEVATPPLSEGCIAGVLRRHLVTAMHRQGFSVTEKPLTLEMLQAADEVFLTNAIRGIRPVKMFGEKMYDHPLTKRIFEEFIAPLAWS